jgi:hypothetical protein
MKLKIWAVGMGVAALALVGCVTNPVYNVTDAPVIASTSNYKVRDVRSAILQAGAAQGWQMQEVQPGLIVGTLNVRDHTAQVDIEYDRKTYNILYKNSYNLKYDGVNIHKNYNEWVQKLNAAISAQLWML